MADPNSLPQSPETLAGGFLSSNGASGLLGVTLVSNAQRSDGTHVCMRLGWRAELCRSATSASLHAGAIITAIDSAMGMCGMQFMQASSGVATLDFRYDEFSAPAPGADVFVEAHCARLDGDILFITGSCRSADGKVLHGRATGRFIRTAANSVPFTATMLSMQSTALPRTSSAASVSPAAPGEE